MIMLSWWLGCVNPRPIVEVDVPVEAAGPASVPATSATDCVGECVRAHQMVAEPIEAITGRCEQTCAHAAEPLGSPAP